MGYLKNKQIGKQSKRKQQKKQQKQQKGQQQNIEQNQDQKTKQQQVQKQNQHSNKQQTIEQENKTRYQDETECNQINLQQNQQMIQQDKQALSEIQYYIFEDLVNFFEVLADVSETMKHFNNDKQHQYIPIALNRLILQTNISNMINFDCSHRYSKDEKSKMFKKEKQEAKQLYDQLLQNIELPEEQTIQRCLEQYQQNFKDQALFNQLELLQTNVKGDFNEKVVENIFSGIQHVDKTKQQVSKGEYKKMTKQEIQDILNLRKERAYQLLNQNFSKNEENLGREEKIDEEFSNLDIKDKTDQEKYPTKEVSYL